ncbi:UDP-N-acetylmuramoyl-tripeptide--D-alanyl-D-alanine ligase [Geopsychrobacter electrodiphilus]|uniref:UDP-N-acetylmuramoyl-tripeptide--D-alanyl-D- alanine ligase n=1 Tax=Geopsychrobacter electrodiphilus TaxID=225196 RepID=UPI000360A698|nr:UDP-N-acetylmuramoyl-tripeptide--D-alanyl-D-alanine ligase [Geopsychrobacter electrodiphilus]
MILDLEMIARITAARMTGDGKSIQISGVSTDSRNINPGELFIPLRGERFDGHDYIIQAVRNGAAACLSEEVIAGLTVPVLLVKDSLRALGDIASAVRQQWHGPLIGITGSAGKTTTKEMLAAILSRTGSGLKTAGNFNNLIGLPLTILNLREDHQWAVIEMGTSALGEIERLTEIAAPNIGVITNVGPVHLETLKGLDGVARAKGELFAGLKGGTAIVNLDDERVASLPIANGVRRVIYGLGSSADVRAEEIRETGSQVFFQLVLPTERHMVKLQTPGRHNALNALAAAAAAWTLGVGGVEISRGLADFIPIHGRMNIFPLPSGGELLDDSYNANPLSVRAALETLTIKTGKGRRIAILGDMLELGDEAERFHYDIGCTAAETSDLLVIIGPLSRQTARGAREKGLKPDQILEFDDCDAAIAGLAGLQRSGDRILVKGSHGMRLDRLAAVLRRAEESPLSIRNGG